MAGGDEHVTADAIGLRRMEPADGPGIDQLGKETPDTGAIAFYSRYHHDAFETLMALNPNTVGVVAAAPGGNLVGLGLVTFGECWFEGEDRPCAYFSSLSVHPDYRRRGIASRLGAWRLGEAQTRFEAAGREGVVFAAIQGGNVGSLRTAETWANQRLDGHTRAGVVGVRSKPPRPMPGIDVRPVALEELEDVAAAQNAFYAEFNLYPADTASSLERWRSQLFFGERLREYYLAADASGAIVAGLGVTAEGPLITGHVVRMPLPLRLANALLRIVPPDGTSRRIKVEKLWFAPGRIQAARHLWESTRWLLRDRGSMLMAFFDTTSVLRDAIVLPRLLPSSTGSVVLKGPVQADRSKPLYLNP